MRVWLCFYWTTGPHIRPIGFLNESRQQSINSHSHVHMIANLCRRPKSSPVVYLHTYNLISPEDLYIPSSSSSRYTADAVRDHGLWIPLSERLRSLMWAEKKINSHEVCVADASNCTYQTTSEFRRKGCLWHSGYSVGPAASRRQINYWAT